MMHKTNITDIFLRVSLLLVIFIFVPFGAHAYYGDGCEQYGLMAYDAGGGYCKCMAGYVFQTSILGTKQCTDANIVCHEKLGYGSRYNSLSDSCECSYGYVLGSDSIGKTSCISENQACVNEYGIHSRSTYGGKCECSYGYVFSGGTCQYGDTVCQARHGIYSSYDTISNACECDSGYTFNDNNQCVKKQNNVYFKLLDLDTGNREAILKSEYDGSQFKITYGTGCFDLAFERYLNSNVVVNLGTDYSLDTWDYIVLQDDDETCYITSRERTYDDSLERPEEYSGYSTVYTKTASFFNKPEDTPIPPKQTVGSDKTEIPVSTSTTDVASSTEEMAQPENHESWWQKVISWFKWW